MAHPGTQEQVHTVVQHCTNQSREVWRRQCCHTATQMYTHVLVQAHCALGLATNHHPRQANRKSPLYQALTETLKNHLKDGQPVEWKKMMLGGPLFFYPCE